MGLLRKSLSASIVVLLVVLVVLASTGCQGSGGDGTTTASITSSSETTSTTPTTETAPTEATESTESTESTSTSSSTTSTSLASSEQKLSNGHIKACGIITEVWDSGGTHKIKIDYVDFLTGAEADAAAIADGLIAAGEHIENDYYARNRSSKLRTFTVSNNAVLTTDDRSLPPGQIVTHTWSEFSDFWNSNGQEPWLSEGLWWIERDGQTVVRIDQQFVP